MPSILRLFTLTFWSPPNEKPWFLLFWARCSSVDFQPLMTEKTQKEGVSGPTVTAQAILDAYEAVTGVCFRPCPPYVQRQASELAGAGFTPEDVRLVILWTRKQVNEKKSGFSKQSEGWRCIFGRHGEGDEFGKWHERLGMARKAMQAGWRPRLQPRPETPGCVPDDLCVPPAPASDESLKQTAADLKAFLLRMKGATG